MTSRTKTSLAYLLTLALLVASGGASCQRQMGNPFAAPAPRPPQLLMDGSGRDQLIAAVNQNSSRIKSLTATGVTITIPDMLLTHLGTLKFAGRFRTRAPSRRSTTTSNSNAARSRFSGPCPERRSRRCERAFGHFFHRKKVMEPTGFEPVTSSMPLRRSTN